MVRIEHMKNSDIHCLYNFLYVLGSSQPVDNLPVLRQLPSEILFRANQEFVVECVVESKEGAVGCV